MNELLFGRWCSLFLMLTFPFGPRASGSCSVQMRWFLSAKCVETRLFVFSPEHTARLVVYHMFTVHCSLSDTPLRVCALSFLSAPCDPDHLYKYEVNMEETVSLLSDCWQDYLIIKLINNADGQKGTWKSKLQTFWWSITLTILCQIFNAVNFFHVLDQPVFSELHAWYALMCFPYGGFSVRRGGSVNLKAAGAQVFVAPSVDGAWWVWTESSQSSWTGSGNVLIVNSDPCFYPFSLSHDQLLFSHSVKGSVQIRWCGCMTSSVCRTGMKLNKVLLWMEVATNT